MPSKFRIVPLMDGPDAASSIIQSDQLTPDAFVRLLDERKAVVLQKANDGEESELELSSLSFFSTEDFGSIVTSLQLEYYPYVGGAAPRTVIPVSADDRPIIFTANER
jgi:hypothetical protein